MANIHRVTYRIFRFMAGVILLSAACLSHAETVPATPGVDYSAPVIGYSYDGVVYSTGAAACAAASDVSPGFSIFGPYDGNPVIFKCSNVSGQYMIGSYVFGCPSGGTLISSGNSRTCWKVYTCPDSSWTLDGQNCVRDENTCPAWGTNYSSGVFDFGTDPANRGGARGAVYA